MLCSNGCDDACDDDDDDDDDDNDDDYGGCNDTDYDGGDYLD